MAEPCRSLLLRFILFGCLAFPIPGAAAQQALIVDPNQFLACPPAGELQQEMVSRLKEARAAARSCGDRSFPAAGPVSWAPSLARAAAVRAGEMASQDFLQHTDPAGREIGERLLEMGYSWVLVGENIAGGFGAVAEVVQHWLASPDHCGNIMESGFTEFGAACRRNRQSTYGTYWTLILATPTGSPPAAEQ